MSLKQKSHPLEAVEKMVWLMSSLLIDLLRKLLSVLFRRPISIISQSPSPTVTALPRSQWRKKNDLPGRFGGDGPDAEMFLHPRAERGDLIAEMIPDWKSHKKVYIALKNLSSGKLGRTGDAAWQTLQAEIPDIVSLLRRYDESGKWDVVRKDLKLAFGTVDTWHLMRFDSASLKYNYGRAAAAEALTSRWRKMLAAEAAHQARLDAAGAGDLPPDGEAAATAAAPRPKAGNAPSDDDDNNSPPAAAAPTPPNL